MLVRFTCEAHRDVLMFGDIATNMLAMMGHSGAVPGALAAAEVAGALARLQQALAAAPRPVDKETDAEQDDERPAPIPITVRALPLIELLTAASREDARVLWYKV